MNIKSVLYSLVKFVAFVAEMTFLDKKSGEGRLNLSKLLAALNHFFGALCHSQFR